MLWSTLMLKKAPVKPKKFPSYLNVKKMAGKINKKMEYLSVVLITNPLMSNGILKTI